MRTRAQRRPAAQLLRRLCALLVLVGVWACGPSGSGPSGAVAVAAASDLRFALDELIADYVAVAPGAVIEPTYGSSGVFYSQLQNRAPFDLYLSADIDYPRRLVAEGLADAESEFAYAVGRIVLWTPKESAADVSRGVDLLRDDAVRRIAIANPEHAPYGRAAVAALRSLGVYEEVEDKLIRGENVAQTLQFVESGAADIGIVALSLALAPTVRDRGSWRELPLDAYPALEQGGVILDWARDPEAARRFRAYLLSEEARVTLERYGFAPAE